MASPSAACSPSFAIEQRELVAARHARRAPEVDDDRLAAQRRRGRTARRRASSRRSPAPARRPPAFGAAPRRPRRPGRQPDRWSRPTAMARASRIGRRGVAGLATGASRCPSCSNGSCTRTCTSRRQRRDVVDLRLDAGEGPLARRRRPRVLDVDVVGDARILVVEGDLERLAGRGREDFSTNSMFLAVMFTSPVRPAGVPIRGSPARRMGPADPAGAGDPDAPASPLRRSPRPVAGGRSGAAPRRRTRTASDAQSSRRASAGRGRSEVAGPVGFDRLAVLLDARRRASRPGSGSGR